LQVQALKWLGEGAFCRHHEKDCIEMKEEGRLCDMRGW